MTIQKVLLIICCSYSLLSTSILIAQENKDIAAVKAAAEQLNSSWTFGLNFGPLQYQFRTSCQNASLAVQLASAALAIRGPQMPMERTTYSVSM